MGQFKRIRLLEEAITNGRELQDLMAYAKVENIQS